MSRKKALAFYRLKGYNVSKSKRSEVNPMSLSHAHSFTFTFGWTRFNGFGSFGMVKRGA